MPSLQNVVKLAGIPLSNVSLSSVVCPHAISNGSISRQAEKKTFAFIRCIKIQISLIAGRTRDVVCRPLLNLGKTIRVLLKLLLHDKFVRIALSAFTVHLHNIYAGRDVSEADALLILPCAESHTLEIEHFKRLISSVHCELTAVE